MLCMGDDHGWDETGYNGHPHLHTPVLDEMGGHGVEAVIDSTPHTLAAHPLEAPCSPGATPNRYGTFAPNWSIRPEEISLAHILSRAGYLCGHFGKWHLGPVKAESPTSPGAMGLRRMALARQLLRDESGAVAQRGPAGGASRRRLTSDCGRDDSIHRPGEEGWQAVFSLSSGSARRTSPIAALEKDLALYDELPAEYEKRQVRLTSMRTGMPTRRPLREVLRERYAEITAMDRAMGELRRELARMGLKDNTLLWYCGDNGIPSSGRATTPFRGQKGEMYEGGIRVPGVIEWPARIAKPLTADVVSVTSDILPTVCDLVRRSAAKPSDRRRQPGPRRLMERWPGARAPSAFGVTRAAPTEIPTSPHICRRGPRRWSRKWPGRRTRNFRNHHHAKITQRDYRGARAIIDNRFKLVVTKSAGAGSAGAGGERQELFDLRADPAERHDLLEARPEVARKLSQELRAWQESVLTSLTGADYRPAK